MRNADIGAEVVRIDQSDLVTPSDIARRMGRTRQLVSLYISGQRGPGGFPAPVCELHGKHPLWSWSEVAWWLHENNLIRSDALQEARQKAVINTVLQLEHQRQQQPELTREVLDALQSH